MSKSAIIVLLLVITSFLPLDRIDWSNIKIPLPTPSQKFEFDEPRNEGFTGFIVNSDTTTSPDVQTQCDCKGTGVIVAGDGTRIPCPFVNPSTGKCEWPNEPKAAEPVTEPEDPTPATITIQKRITSMEGYQSPGGWHRHRMQDGTILEHEDWNNGVPGAHNGAIGYRTWRGMRFPRYTGPDLPSNVEFYVEETVPVEQAPKQEIPPPPPVQAPPVQKVEPKVTEAPKTVHRQLVMFTAAWCGPCQTFKRTELPKLQRMGYTVAHSEDPEAKRIAANIRIVDVDQHPTLKERFGVNFVPIFVLFEDAKEVLRLEGYQTAETIKGVLDAEPSRSTK